MKGKLDSSTIIAGIFNTQLSVVGGLVTKSCLTLVTPWTIAHQVPLSMGFSRQEDWSGLPCPPPGDLPSPGIKPASPASPALQVDSLLTEPRGEPRECSFSSVHFTHSVMSDSLRRHESQHARPPCPSQTPRVHSDSC